MTRDLIVDVASCTVARWLAAVLPATNRPADVAGAVRSEVCSAVEARSIAEIQLARRRGSRAAVKCVRIFTNLIHELVADRGIVGAAPGRHRGKGPYIIIAGILRAAIVPPVGRLLQTGA